MALIDGPMPLSIPVPHFQQEEEPDWFAKATEGGITIAAANGIPDSTPKVPVPEAAVPQQKAPAAQAPAIAPKVAANGATPVMADEPEVKEPEVTRVESFRSISKFDQWISPFVSGRRPPPRYQVCGHFFPDCL